jgi:hypothetical protein
MLAASQAGGLPSAHVPVFVCEARHSEGTEERRMHPELACKIQIVVEFCIQKQGLWVKYQSMSLD